MEDVCFSKLKYIWNCEHFDKELRCVCSQLARAHKVDKIVTSNTELYAYMDVLEWNCNFI